MKKIKYIFLTVTIALVTVFYIINIKGKDQQIISERLPKAVLIANNENQNPETIPSPQEVVKEIDDYARKHNVFIVMDIVTPAGSEDFKPTYITFGTGKLASNMILFPKANRANNDLLGMGATYNILKGHGSAEELSQYLNQKFHVTASYFPTMSLIGEYYNIYGNPQAVTLLISIFLAFVGLAIFVRISELRKSGIELLSGKTLLNTVFSDSICDIKFISILTIIAMIGTSSYLLITGLSNLSLHIFALFSIFFSSLIFVLLSCLVSAIIMIILSRSQLNSLIKGKLPTIALMVLVVLMQFAVSLVLVTSLSGIHYNQIELKKQEADLDKWKEEKDYYTFPYASINLQVSNQEAKSWWNFYNIEVTKDDAIFVRHDLFAGPEESSQDQLFVTPSYLKAQHIKTKEDFSNLKLGEYALLIPKNQMKNRQKLITKYNKSLTETTQNGKKETKMKAKYVEEVPNGEKRFIYNVAYEKMTTQQEISDPIIIVITPKSSGEETGLSWAGDNDYFFVKGKEQTINRLKKLGLYDKVHYLVNAYGQYEAQTNLVKESLNMAIMSAIITIIVISFFYILLHVLYFTHFRRTIVIKFISGMPNLRIHRRFIFVELGLLLILLPTLTIISNEFLYSLFVVSALWFISLIILLVQMKNFENGQINSLKGE
ncbi:MULTISPECIES: bacteriocin-associated integral membrane family protein [Lactococcus]|jgi:putative ABC transport system permease protein|uniref:bacteriocin-associated integral membrane family protein n=1 Tax=Lactococcus TaxID=1357 RepID=UPI000346D3BE|nr:MULTISPECIES: bacteriocin-associated integral membrane family protein [Lactococcus]MCA2381873.1 bacteriocin-associated integral membrane family protein [Lactococcus sp. SK2-659]MCI2095569.1 bacteriocin-associated integral membrane family protein [Lactococcus lactis]MCI2139224.1 bacteriocin-associated integral membrane family protein [Lactococcus lactis]MCI2188712.1 bacteriocin-associated integral membrane family protein [Lactococcus lactis]THA53671.1 bacteriocin-associated integral membrane